MVCPAETPEGQACGLVKNLSLMAFVSVGSNAGTQNNLLDELGVETLADMDPDTLQNKNIVKVFVNGNWYGIHRDANTLT
jgi:DNA-directed RNA polymerase II subunit RPB2